MVVRGLSDITFEKIGFSGMLYMTGLIYIINCRASGIALPMSLNNIPNGVSKSPIQKPTVINAIRKIGRKNISTEG
jgi:hypothetical protein